MLFNIFINDVFDVIKNENSVNLNNNYSFNALMYADDLIIMSTPQEGLQKNA